MDEIHVETAASVHDDRDDPSATDAAIITTSRSSSPLTPFLGQESESESETQIEAIEGHQWRLRQEDRDHVLNHHRHLEREEHESHHDGSDGRRRRRRPRGLCRFGRSQDDSATTSMSLFAAFMSVSLSVSLPLLFMSTNIDYHQHQAGGVVDAFTTTVYSPLLSSAMSSISTSTSISTLARRSKEIAYYYDCRASSSSALLSKVAEASSHGNTPAPSSERDNDDEEEEEEEGGDDRSPPISLVIEKLSDTTMYRKNMLDDSVYKDISRLCRQVMFEDNVIDGDDVASSEKNKKHRQQLRDNVKPSAIKSRIEQQQHHVTTEMFLAYEMRLATPEEREEYEHKQLLKAKRRQAQAEAVEREIAAKMAAEQQRHRHYHHQQQHFYQGGVVGGGMGGVAPNTSRRRTTTQPMEPDFADFNRPKKQYHDPYRNEEMFPHHPNDPFGHGSRRPHGGGGSQSMQAQQQKQRNSQNRRVVHTNVVNSAQSSSSNNEKWGVDRPFMDDFAGGSVYDYYSSSRGVAADDRMYGGGGGQGRGSSSSTVSPVSPNVVIGGTTGAFAPDSGATTPGWGANQATTNGTSQQQKQRRVRYQPGMVDSTTGWPESSPSSSPFGWNGVGDMGGGGRKPAGGSTYVHGQRPLHAHKHNQHQHGTHFRGGRSGPLFAHYPTDPFHHHQHNFDYGRDGNGGPDDPFYNSPGDGMFAPRAATDVPSPEAFGDMGGTQSYQSFKRQQQRRQQQRRHQTVGHNDSRQQHYPHDPFQDGGDAGFGGNGASMNKNDGELYVRGDLIGFVEVSHEPYTFGQFEQDQSILDAKFIPHRSVLRNLVVSKDYQRAGVGSKLVEEVEKHVRQHFNLYEVICEFDHLSVATTAPTASVLDASNNDATLDAMKFFMDRGYEVMFTEPETDSTVRRDVLRKDLKKESTNFSTEDGKQHDASASSSSPSGFTNIDGRPSMYDPSKHKPRSGSDVNAGMHGIPDSYAKVHPGSTPQDMTSGGKNHQQSPTDYSSETDIVDIDDFVVETVVDDDEDGDRGHDSKNPNQQPRRPRRVTIPVDPF